MQGAWVEIGSRDRLNVQTVRSLPVRGAWVEMSPPRGVRVLCRSLPVQGAWVEMDALVRHIFPSVSLPVRGAWVEISKPQSIDVIKPRRSPCGERGLKFSVVMMKMGRMRRIFPVASAAPSCGKRLHRHAFVTRNDPNFPAPPWFSPSSDIANSAIRAPTHVCRAGLNGSPKRRQSP